MMRDTAMRIKALYINTLFFFMIFTFRLNILNDIRFCTVLELRMYLTNDFERKILCISCRCDKLIASATRGVEIIPHGLIKIRKIY